jgi:bifunctional non-homologous end joining protein LigD
VTKLELVRYYESVAQWMLPHLKGRPCSLVRGPNGVAGELFYQKHLNEQAVPEVRELPVALWPGHPSLIEIPSRRALVAAAQMNVIEFHTWNAVERKIDKPDRVIFDLDPGEGVPWQHVQEAALLVRGMLTELQLESWLKTSGGKGLHVVVPLTPRAGWDEVRAFSEAVVQHMAKVIPQRFVAKSGAGNRVGRIFIDYLRNTHGATTAAAYSARSRPGLGVSMPIAWDDLGALKGSDQWTVRTAREYLSFQRADPWAGYWVCKQTIAAGVKALSMRG